MYEIRNENMYEIRNENMRPEVVDTISKYIDMKNGYEPKVEFNIVYNNVGFKIKFKVYEKEPRAECKEHFDPVCTDSCVEWFVNFLPEKNDRYFNFEVNAKGIMDVAFRKSRYEFDRMTADDVEMLNIHTEIYDDYWCVEYVVPFELIKKYIPGYEFEKDKEILVNLYKCGEKTEFEHYAYYYDIDLETEDFHVPHLFGKMRIV